MRARTSRRFLKDAIAQFAKRLSRVSASASSARVRCVQLRYISSSRYLATRGHAWKMTQAQVRIGVASRFAMQMICIVCTYVRKTCVGGKRRSLREDRKHVTSENYECGRLNSYEYLNYLHDLLHCSCSN